MSSWFGLSIPDSNMLKVYANFDGPLYIIPAKTLYDFSATNLALPLEPEYFAAHLPLYPLFILLFSPLLGFLKSMLFTTVLFSVALVCVFYYLLKRFKLTAHPFMLTMVFLFLPRFLVIRSVGAPETLFMFFILLSVLFFEKKNYLIAGLLGGLAVMTKTPGILLFFAYTAVFIEQYLRTKRVEWGGVNILFIPLGLILVFAWYWLQYGDFFAYFHTGGVVPLVFPFSVFNFQKEWVGTGWLEEIIFYFFMYGLAVVSLKVSPHRSFFYFSLVFFIATLFVQHRDIARYSLPLWPFACIAFEKFFTSKQFRIVALIMLPGILMYAWNFILYNGMPIIDWGPYL